MLARYYQRGTPATTLICFQWDGNNEKDMNDFMALFRPNSNWTVSFSAGSPTVYKSGVSQGGPAIGDWVLGLAWLDSSSPSYDNDVNFHSSWALALS